MGPREWGMLLILSVLWGGSFFFVDVAVAELLTFTIVFLRVGIAAIGLHVVLRIFGERMPAGFAIWRTFLIPVSAIILGAAFLAERLQTNHFIGMAVIGLGLAAIDGRILKRLQRMRNRA